MAMLPCSLPTFAFSSLSLTVTVRLQVGPHVNVLELAFLARLAVHARIWSAPNLAHLLRPAVDPLGRKPPSDRVVDAWL